MTTTSAGAKRPGGARVAVQRFGTFLSDMIMPNIAAFIAWGIVTAVLHPGRVDAQRGARRTRRADDHLPAAAADRQPGRPTRLRHPGGVVASIATWASSSGTDIPMFLGAMIMGPLAAWIMKQIDKLWEGKIQAGFEMLVNNFSAGILGFVLAIAGFFAFGPGGAVASATRSRARSTGWSRSTLLPLLSILVEPGEGAVPEQRHQPRRVHAARHRSRPSETGKSILFLVEANPGPGLGLLLAFTFFGVGMARATAPGAIIIQFFGGIHEIYFPYVLMKPLLIVAAIAGGMTGVATNVLFNSGLRAPAAPGSIIAVLAQTATRQLRRRDPVGDPLGGGVVPHRGDHPARQSQARPRDRGRRRPVGARSRRPRRTRARSRRPREPRRPRASPPVPSSSSEGEAAAFERKPIHNDHLRVRRGHGLERDGRDGAAQQDQEGGHRQRHGDEQGDREPRPTTSTS